MFRPATAMTWRGHRLGLLISLFPMDCEFQRFSDRSSFSSSSLPAISRTPASRQPGSQSASGQATRERQPELSTQSRRDSD
jgi:hypothetical protein